MQKLAINGGSPVFNEKHSREYAPHWPIAYPETEQRLLEIFRSGAWAGRKTYEQKLETEFAAFQKAEYSIWMCNGTTTLECALLALGIGPGDEVIVPGASWVATAQAPLYVGATPVIVDIEPDTLCLDPVQLEAAITPRTKAVIPVHLFSAVADMDKIMKIAQKYNLYVVEDSAHAHGALWRGKGAGSIGDVGSFSFQLSKLMTAGEGGCCTTNDFNLAERIFRLSHIGNSHWKPGTVPESDLNCHQYRFTEFQAAIIYDQLLHQAELMEKRNKNGNLIQELLKNVPGITMQKTAPGTERQSYYFVTFLLDTEMLKPNIDRASIFEALEAEGVSLHSGWGCPLYKSLAWNVPEEKFVLHNCPVSEKAMNERVMIWSHNMLLCETEIIEKSASAISKVIKAYMK